MKMANRLVERSKIGLGVVLLAVLMGCVGYVGPDYGGAIVVPGPPVVVFGGLYERGPDVRVYGHRGFESRAVAHPPHFAPVRRR